MQFKKTEYFKLFSESINIQLNERYDVGLVHRHKQEYLEYEQNRDDENFSLNGR